jgi:hypothetical protein
MTILPDPRDPVCGRLAADMEDLDYSWPEDVAAAMDMEEDDKRAERVAFARTDGTYNRANGHFWCNACYIAIGMPLGVAP